MSTDKNLAKDIPQVSKRALAYKLSDDGAIALAHRRRWKKNAGKKTIEEQIVIEKRWIAHLTKILNSEHTDHAHSVSLKKMILSHEKRIRQLESGVEEVLRPDASIVPPITRRVKREDRKREKRSRRSKSNKSNQI